MKLRLITILLLAALALSLLAGCNEKKELLSEEEAYAVVYKHAGVAEADAVDPHFHVVAENGQTQYNIHFSVGSVEYDYYIDCYTGDILSATP